MTVKLKITLDYAEPFSEGMAMIRQFSDGTTITRSSYLDGYINKSGKIVIKPQYARVEPFSDGLAVVHEWNGSDFDYYIDNKGKQAIPERFAFASPFFKGLAHVKIKSDTGENTHDLKGSFAYIDVTGRKVFEYTNE